MDILLGRRPIFTTIGPKEVNSGNVIDLLTKALPIHKRNAAEIDYLYNYYRGYQPIVNREKDVRPEINNKIVENRADEIVSFKTGYLIGEPIQYVGRNKDNDVSEKVSELNNYMLSEDKPTLDTELVDWMHICGVGYRMTLPDPDDVDDIDEAPFEVYTLDPRTTFVIRQNVIGKPIVANVTYTVAVNDMGQEHEIYSVYTRDKYFEISDGKVVKDIPQYLGFPIIEYPLNFSRQGAFEKVIPLLDAINTTESNRVDGIEQFIQALLLFHNVDISSEDYGQLRRDGAIKFKDVDANMKAEIKYLTEELNQTQTQTLVDHMYNTVLTICGMPNRNGGSSTSDTGAAVELRDGWSAAESRAKTTEQMFKRSENQFLKSTIRICRTLRGMDLRISDIETRFTRRNYGNITEKANVLVAMLNNPKIAPILAFIHCGMFSDPALAYEMSREYAEEQEKKALNNPAAPEEEEEPKNEDPPEQ